MAHGSGGGAMQRLIKEVFAKEFPYLQSTSDAATITCGQKMAFTTDSFVVDPIFFPGGNIGSLAVHGTVNDLAMMGAVPKYMSVAFIIEEGFPFTDLKEIIVTMAKAAKTAGVQIVTGDTKVVGRGQCQGIYINTTGIGEQIETELMVAPHPSHVSEKDAIIVSGDIGRHGMAIMSVRNNLAVEPPILTDSADLGEMVQELYRQGITPSCMRDATRGGVAAVLNEIAEVRKVHLRINEESVPVAENVRGLAEILGLDPLHIANEGTFVLFVSPNDAERVVAILRTFANGRGAAIIGEVVAVHEHGLVTAKTMLGSEKMIHMPEGELLPRIC